ncbi:hypothetical protein HZA97_07755 [Candidatus Woesearchaeota archaeon]|nr:hypothetical protein [Candidatus Woesearchaeota archaeon]
MRTLNKVLSIAALTILFGGCYSRPTNYLQGKVVKELGSVPLLNHDPNSIFRKEPISISEMSYALKVETEQGIYTFSIYEEMIEDTRIAKPLLALEDQIEVGDIVKFPTNIPNGSGARMCDLFSEDKMGKVPSCFVSVVKKKGE